MLLHVKLRSMRERIDFIYVFTYLINLLFCLWLPWLMKSNKQRVDFKICRLVKSRAQSKLSMKSPKLSIIFTWFYVYNLLDYFVIYMNPFWSIFLHGLYFLNLFLQDIKKKKKAITFPPKQSICLSMINYKN